MPDDASPTRTKASQAHEATLPITIALTADAMSTVCTPILVRAAAIVMSDYLGFFIRPITHFKFHFGQQSRQLADAWRVYEDKIATGAGAEVTCYHVKVSSDAIYDRRPDFACA